MKKKLLLLPFLAALALAGCSNDDDLTTGGGEEPEPGDLRYLAVNIVTPKESANQPMSRANNGGFESGSDDENAVNEALFVLLDNNDKIVQTPVTVNGEELKEWTNGTAGSVDKISQAVLVIDGQNSKPENIKGILAVLNPTTTIKGAIKLGMTLAEVKEIVNNYGTTDSSAGSFVMTNSAYVADGAVKLAAEVKEENLQKSPETAKTQAVNIYVERVVAKIRTNKIDNITTVGEGSFNQGAEVKLGDAATATPVTIVIKGIQIANCAQKSYLFKNVEAYKDAAAAPFTDWNDAADHRSYWATVPMLAHWGDYENHSWNQISGASTDVAKPNTGKLLTEAQNFYVQENIHNSGLGAGPGHTSVIVTAQLQYKDQPDKALDIVKIADKYYTAEDGLTKLASFLEQRGYRVKTVTPATETEEGKTTYETLPVSSLEWLESAPENADEVKGWEGFAGVKADYITTVTSADKTFVKWNSTLNAYDEIAEPAAAFKTLFAEKAFRVLKWSNGASYYFVDIEHFGRTTTGEGDAQQTVTLKGIIRNHIYSLNLQSLKGLGVPVFDPKVDIIPEKPTEGEYFYLAARINILKWVFVNQDVNFE